MLNRRGRAVPAEGDVPRGTREMTRVVTGARLIGARFASAPLRLTYPCLSYALLVA
jgi:hypothetical protein